MRNGSERSLESEITIRGRGRELAVDGDPRGTGDRQSTAESHAKNISAALLLNLGPNIAPRLGTIPCLDCQRAPGVRIPPSPPPSRYLWGPSPQIPEIARGCRVIYAW